MSWLDWLSRALSPAPSGPATALMAAGAPGLPAPPPSPQADLPAPAALDVRPAAPVGPALAALPLPPPALPRPGDGIPALAVELIQEFERCHRCVGALIYPYLDGGGVATLGWGNTFWESGRPVSMKDPAISQARADALFAHHIKVFARDVRTALPDSVPDRDLSVFLSLAWNIGTPAFIASTAARRYRQGDRAGALLALEWFNLKDGKVDRGLQIRRRAERLIAGGLSIPAARAQAERDFPPSRRT